MRLSPYSIFIGVTIVISTLLTGCITKPTGVRMRTTNSDQVVIQAANLIDLGEDGLQLIRAEGLFEVSNGTIIDPKITGYIPRAREVIRASSSREMQLRKLLGDYWLVVQMPPSSLWPLMQTYLSQYESIGNSDPLEGLMATKWVGEEGNQTRLLFEISAGLISSTSEIVLLKQQRENETSLERTIEFDVSSYFQFLIEVLQGAPQASSSLVAQNLDRNLKLETALMSDGSPGLNFKLGFDRTWSTVQLALGKAQLEVLESNKKEGWVQVRFLWELSEKVWPKVAQNVEHFTSFKGYQPLPIQNYQRTRAVGVNQVERFIDFEKLPNGFTLVNVRPLGEGFDYNQERLTSIMLQHLQ